MFKHLILLTLLASAAPMMACKQCKHHPSAQQTKSAQATIKNSGVPRGERQHKPHALHNNTPRKNTPLLRSDSDVKPQEVLSYEGQARRNVFKTVGAFMAGVGTAIFAGLAFIWF